MRRAIDPAAPVAAAVRALSTALAEGDDPTIAAAVGRLHGMVAGPTVGVACTQLAERYRAEIGAAYGSARRALWWTPALIEDGVSAHVEVLLRDIVLGGCLVAAAVQVHLAEDESVTGTHNEKGSKEARSVRLGRVDDLCLYEISEHELAQLEAGSPVSVLLNCATFAAGVCLSALSVLLSVDFPEARIWAYVVFVVLAAVSGAVTLVCTSVWLRYGQSNKALVQRIRDRLKESDPLTSDKPATRPRPLTGPTENESDV